MSIRDWRGHTVDIIAIDWRLLMWTDDNWEISASSPVVMISLDRAGKVTDQQVFEVDVAPTDPPDDVAGLIGLPIVDVEITEASQLRLVFADRELRCDADPDYEAWQISGQRGEKWICTPGGEVTHFSPTL